MWQSLLEYVKALFTGWLGLFAVGSVGGLLGLAFDLVPNFEMPVWGWVLIGVAALQISAFKAFHDVRQQRDLYWPDRQEPDWSLHSAFDYVLNNKRWLDGRDARDMPLEAMKALRQAAVEGKITVWGSRYFSIHESQPIVPIEPEYWRAYRFDHTRCRMDIEHAGGCRTEPDIQAGQLGPFTLYDRVQVNEAQTKAVWPA